jgi:hypothetical protein
VSKWVDKQLERYDRGLRGAVRREQARNRENNPPSGLTAVLLVIVIVFLAAVWLLG